MSVTVDYLVVCSGEMDEMDLMELLTEILKDELEVIDGELSDIEQLSQYIDIRYIKMREDGRRICGFSVQFDNGLVEFDSASEEMRNLIREFSKSVAGCTNEGIEHLLKLNDFQLQHELRKYGKEIFEIEMNLREALSLIFVDTYGEDFYKLLKEVSVEPTGQRKPQESQMQAEYENQLFFLDFSDYINMNARKDLSLGRIKEYMGQAADFEELKRRITTNPIIKEEYNAFLTRLQERLNPIEKLRNCVAHNRPIPRRIIGSYEKARDLLLKEIKDFLEEQDNSEVNGDTKDGD